MLLIIWLLITVEILIYMKNLLSLTLLLSLLTACGGSYKKYVPFMGEDDVTSAKQVAGKEVATDPTDQELYDEALEYLDKARFSKSIETFHEIERLYPFSKFAIKANVMTAYSHYKAGDYDDAIIVIDRFTRVNPGNKDIAYMYYLKALSYYERITDIKRDQEVTKLALTSLNEVINRFPDSDYSRDAKVKLDLVRDHLAGKEMEIGRFYLKNKKYIAAVNRFQVVVDNFQTTSHIEEALYRLTESYLSLGLQDDAKKTASILGHNYPASKWYKYAYRLVAEGKNAPKSVDGSWFGLGGAAESKPILKDSSKADSWFEKIKNIF